MRADRELPGVTFCRLSSLFIFAAVAAFFIVLPGCREVDETSWPSVTTDLPEPAPPLSASSIGGVKSDYPSTTSAYNNGYVDPPKEDSSYDWEDFPSSGCSRELVRYQPGSDDVLPEGVKLPPLVNLDPVAGELPNPEILDELQPITITVLNENGEPVEDATLDFSGYGYELEAKTDTSGHGVLELDRLREIGSTVSSYSSYYMEKGELRIYAKGYLLQNYLWSQSERYSENDGPIPVSIEVRLEPRILIGGYLRTESGEPIPRQRILLELETGAEKVYERSHIDSNHRSIRCITTTWEDGGWVFPVSNDDVSLTIEIPGALGTLSNGPRNHDDQRSFKLDLKSADREMLLNKQYVLTVPWGPSITGKVTDSDGEPMRNATIKAGLKAGDNNRLHTTGLVGCVTGADGSYNLLVAPEVNEVEFLVLASGHAMQPRRIVLKNLNDKEDDIEVAKAGPDGKLICNIVLKPEKPLRFRVIDRKTEKPISGAKPNVWCIPTEHADIMRLSAESLNALQQTDAEGRWNCDPFSDEIRVFGVGFLKDKYITRCPTPIGSHRRLSLEEDEPVQIEVVGGEYIYYMDRWPILRGMVVDAETEESIQEFTVTPGNFGFGWRGNEYFPNDNEEFIDCFIWEEKSTRRFVDGVYYLQHYLDCGSICYPMPDEFPLLFEAEGYEPFITEMFPITEPEVTRNVRMVRANGGGQ